MTENPTDTEAAALEAELAAATPPAAPAPVAAPQPATLPPIDDPGASAPPIPAAVEEMAAAQEKADKAAEALRVKKAEAFKGPEDGPLEAGPRAGTCYRVKVGRTVTASTGRMSMSAGTLVYAGDPRLRKYPDAFEVCETPNPEKPPPPRYALHSSEFPIAVGPRILSVR